MTNRIYVACLASYNNGQLHGIWIDLDALAYDDSKVESAVLSMLDDSPIESAEEYAIHDSELPFEINEFYSCLLYTSDAADE